MRQKFLSLLLSGALLISSIPAAFAADPSAMTDISGHWAEENIGWVMEQELFNGVSETEFSPNGSMTRGMFVTVLGRYAGIDPEQYRDWYLPGLYGDVAEDRYYAPYINWATRFGIANGTSEDLFSPDEPVTREQMATLILRFASIYRFDIAQTTEEIVEAFTDFDTVGNFAKDAVETMRQTGLLNGIRQEDGTYLFSTKTNATRAQCATILQRFISWMNGDPPMPSGAVPVSGAQSFDSCNTYAPKNAVQDINYWSNYQVCYKNEPNPKDNVVIYRLKNVTTDQVKAYVQMLQNNGFTLKGSYSRKNLYSWGLISNAVPNATAHNLMYEEGIACHVSLWHSDSGWFFYVSPDLEVCDLGLRIDGTTADRRPWGESADSGLLQLYPGRYQTSDGRLAATVGCATVLQDGKSTTNYLQASLNDDGILQLRVLSGNDTLIRFDYENGTLRKNTTLRRQELEAEGNPDLRVLLGSKLCTLDYTSQYLRQCTVRIMEQTSDMIVFYIYASLNATPSQIEALCVLSVADIETPEDREENNNNNSTTPDHDNDYGSALTCTACRGSGDCSKCGGDGKIWSSASDKENRNCTKCNGSGRCTTCNGSGKRYN